MAGADRVIVREILGHVDLKMTMRYIHLSPDHRLQAVEVLGSKVLPSPLPASTAQFRVQSATKNEKGPRNTLRSPWFFWWS